MEEFGYAGRHLADDLALAATILEEIRIAYDLSPSHLALVELATTRLWDLLQTLAEPAAPPSLAEQIHVH